MKDEVTVDNELKRLTFSSWSKYVFDVRVHGKDTYSRKG